MKAVTLVAAAVLVLVPTVALYWDGGGHAAPARGMAVAVAAPAPGPQLAPVPGPQLAPVPGPQLAPAPGPQLAPVPGPQLAPVPGPQTAPAPNPDPVPRLSPPPPASDTPSGWGRAPALSFAVTKAMANFPGRYSVIVHELGTGDQWVLNGADRYHPASTIKMPVALYALEQYRSGKLRWNEGIQYTAADFESPGGGAFETAPFGDYYPVENLVGRALRYSNNVAVNMLGRRLGWPEIRAWSRTIDGELYRQDDGTPEVTALSELGWWRHLEKLSREDPTSAELLLQPLREVAYDGRIAAGLPAGVKYLHKFGSYDGNYHDGGIIFAQRSYILIVMTEGASVDQADDSIARVSAEIYKVMVK